MSAPRKLAWIAVSVALLLASPAPAFAGGGDITPESANSARFGVEQEGKLLVDRGDYQAAAELYWREGVRLKDPVLIIASAEAHRDRAAAERSIDAARSAIERVAPALDMLYFSRDGSPSKAWAPVAAEHLAAVITRAHAVITDATALIDAIELEQRQAAEAATAAAGPQESPTRAPAKPGTVMIIGGSSALVVGIAGAGLGIVGLSLGARAQSQVEDPLVYEPDHSAAAQRGQTANLLAGVGFAVAGVGLGLGATLLALGVNKRKRAGAGEVAVVPVWNGHGAGLGVVGRF